MAKARMRGDTEFDDLESSSVENGSYVANSSATRVDVSGNGHNVRAMRTKFKTFDEIFRYVVGEMRNRELAELSRTSQSSISKAANGLPPPLGHLKRWARALKIEGEVLDDFMRLGRDARIMAKRDIAPLFREVQGELHATERDVLELARAIREVAADPAALAQGIAQKDRAVLQALHMLVKTSDAIIEKYRRR